MYMYMFYETLKAIYVDHHFLKNVRLIFHSAKKRKNIIYCLAESTQQLSLDLMLTSRMMTQNFLFPGPMVH